MTYSTPTAYSQLEQTAYKGRVAHIFREENQWQNNVFCGYIYEKGVRNILIPLMPDTAGGHKTDNAFVSLTQANAVTAPQIVMDSPFRLDRTVGFDVLNQIGPYLPQAWAESMGRQYAQETQSIKVAGVAAGITDRTLANTTNVTNCSSIASSDGSTEAAAVYAALTAIRKRKANFKRINGYVVPEIFTQLRKVSYIASSFYQFSNAENSNLTEAYKVLGANVMTEADCLQKNLATTSNIGTSGVTVTYDSKYAIDLSRITGIFWDREAYWVGECEEINSNISEQGLIQGMLFVTRGNFGTKVIKTDGVQLVYT